MRQPSLRRCVLRWTRSLCIAGGVVVLGAAISAQEAEESTEVKKGSLAEAVKAAREKAAPAPENRLSLADMLKAVKARAAAEKQSDRERLSRFQSARDTQNRKTLQTEALVRQEEALGISLEDTFSANETELEELDVRLTERIGQMGELFGVVRLVATDLSGEVWTSLTSLGIPPRAPRLDKMGRNTGLPSTEDMEALWHELLREMTAQGQVVRAKVPVVASPDNENPQASEAVVVRVGPFNAAVDGEYVDWNAALQKVQRLERQPPPRYTETLPALSREGEGFRRVAVDPSRGVLMVALTDTPSLLERVNQGGYVGYTIVGLGLLALAIGLLRLVVLTLTNHRVQQQTGSAAPSDDNPLGRLLGVYAEHRHYDPGVLEQKLDDSVMRESASIESYLWVVQTISVIAPLLGLLGTVTGMIQTFQAITLFGAGDPKIMAGGISEALVTTTLGLVTAIPLVLLHALLVSRSRAITDELNERATSLVAERLEDLAA